MFYETVSKFTCAKSIEKKLPLDFFHVLTSRAALYIFRAISPKLAYLLTAIKKNSMQVLNFNLFIAAVLEAATSLTCDPPNTAGLKSILCRRL